MSLHRIFCVTNRSLILIGFFLQPAPLPNHCLFGRLFATVSTLFKLHSFLVVMLFSLADITLLPLISALLSCEQMFSTGLLVILRAVDHWCSITHPLLVGIPSPAAARANTPIILIIVVIPIVCNCYVQLSTSVIEKLMELCYNPQNNTRTPARRYTQENHWNCGIYWKVARSMRRSTTEQTTQTGDATTLCQRAVEQEMPTSSLPLQDAFRSDQQTLPSIPR